VTGTLDVPDFELRPAANTPVVQNIPGFTLKAATPIHLALSSSTVRLDPVRLVAPSTELTVDGTVDIAREPYVNLRLRGTANLALARNFVQDLTSSGTLVVDATLRGTESAPLFSGRATLRDGEFHYGGFNNGLTGVTGEIVFNGPRATIQSLSGETGGGKVNASGFAALSGNTLAFRLDARAVSVRVRYPEGVSSVSDVSLTVAGTSDRSEASGSVIIHRLAVNPKADLASIISSASGPQPALSLGGLMANMNLDIQVATAPDVAFESDVAQGLEADANLRLRGTAANPALLGRVNVSHGELSFFGNKYTITQGNVSFYNPARIEPVMNIDLSTKARGVEVILTVAGPPDKLNMSYRSDPPLEFGDIISLLATGRAPTESTVASRGTGPTAGFEQMGAGALLGQALASPVAGRLQRFFGVSRLKIDPELSGVTGSPAARLTIEQQITPDILFTYVADVAHTNDQLIRVEWSINRQVSAVLQREENGYVGLDFVWKKRLK
jgi:translocation and assembly module TamB